MKTNIKILLILIIWGTSILVKAQSCVIKSEKLIEEGSSLNYSCVDYSARDKITLKPGFRFTSNFQGKPKIVRLTWSYGSAYLDWTPTVTVNSSSFSGMLALTQMDYYLFYSCIADLAYRLSSLDSSWSINLIPPDGTNKQASIEISYNGNFNIYGNYYSSSIIQNYEVAKNATFSAKVNNDLLFPVDYIPTSQAPDPSKRTLETSNSSFGSLPGEINVSPSGAATYDIPINILPGLNGMEPQISINYNSQSGNGILGWGWNINGLSTISRIPQNVYSDNIGGGISLGINDRFAINGNRLIVVDKNYGENNSTYRTENETFIIVKAHVTNENFGPDWFEVVDKNGTIYKYGSSNGRIQIGTNYYSWQIDYVEDINGNYMEYTYEKFGLAAFIKKINYGKNVNNKNLVANTIEFLYEARSDIKTFKILSYSGVMDKILNKIKVSRGNVLYRTYSFEYTKDVYSRLVKINLANNEGEFFNPTIIKWGNFNDIIALNNNVTVGNSSQYYFGINTDNQTFLAADIDNDGKSDLLSIHTNYYDYNSISGEVIEVYKNSSSDKNNLIFNSGFSIFNPTLAFDPLFKKSGSFINDIDKNGVIDFVSPFFVIRDKTLVLECRINNSYETSNLMYRLTSNERPAYSLADYNNDGKLEFLFIDQTSHIGSLITFDPANIDNSSKKDFAFTGITGNVKQILESDYNGDGLLDIFVITDQKSFMFLNRGGSELFSLTPLYLGMTGLNDFLNSNHHIIKQGDFNGDGATDILYETSATWMLATGSNQGFFTLTPMNLPLTDVGHDKGTGDDDGADNCYVFDYNMDGKSDIIITNYACKKIDNWWEPTYYEFSKFYLYWFKSTGTGFTLFKSQTSDREIDAASRYFVLGDFNGDGKTDLLNYGPDWLNNSSTERKWRLYAANASDDEGLVTSIANGINQVTNINYKNMVWADNYTHANLTGKLYSQVVPLPLVYSVENIRKIGGNTTRLFTYNRATFHKDIGFLGFLETSVKNTSTNLKNTSTYSFSIQGTSDVFYAPLLSNVVSKIENSSSNSVIIGRRTDTYDLHHYGGKRIFVYPSTSFAEDFLEFSNVKTTSKYDLNGNVTSIETKYLEPNSETATAKNLVESSGYAARVANSVNTIPGLPSLVVSSKWHKDDGENEFKETTSFAYDTKGRVSKKINNGITSSFAYDDYGSILSSSAVASGKSRNSYFKADPTKRFAEEVSNDKGHAVVSKYNFWGNKVSETDANNISTSFTYDNWGSPLVQAEADGTTAKYLVKWSKGDSDAHADALFAKYAYKNDRLIAAEYFNTDGYLLKRMTVGKFNVKLYTDFEYNAKGELVKESDPYTSSATRFTTYVYDDYKRLTSETTPENLTISYVYPASSSERTYKTLLSTGEESIKRTDAAGLVSKVTDKGGSITYLYHSSWQPASINANGTSTQITYYPNGLQKTLVDPDANTTTYEYNDFLELSKQVNSNGTVQLLYDILGRDSIKIVGNKTYRYSYDPANGKGLLSSVVCDDNSIAGYIYIYDNLSRPSTITRSNNDQSFRYIYEYGNGSKLASVTYPNDFKVKYTYNAYDDLMRISDANDNLVWKVDANDSKGRITKTSNGSNKQLSIVYDVNDRLSELSVPGLISFQYGFNSRDQLDWREEKFVKNSQLQGFRESLKYDNVNRLTEVYKRNPQTQVDIQTLQMVYKSGTSDRIETKSDIGTYGYNSTANHKLDEIIPYSDYLPPTHDIRYNEEGMVDTLIETSSGVNKQNRFVYGLDAQRFKSEYAENGSIKYTRYYFGGYEKEVKANGTTKHLNYVYAEGSLIAIYEQGATSKMHYIYTDYLGSLRCITDANGNVEQNLSFDAWGYRRDPFDAHKLSDSEIVAVTTITSRGYTGHEHLDEFNLINMNRRLYDPALGLFLSPDPYVAFPYSSQSYNRYSYCLNNPFMYTDPAGENPIVIGICIFAAGFALKTYGELNNNAYLSKIGSWTMIGGSVVMGFGFTSVGILPAIIGNGYMSGFITAAHGGDFWQGFMQGAAASIILGGLKLGWEALGNLKLPAIDPAGKVALNVERDQLVRHMYKAINDLGNKVPSILTDGMRIAPLAMPAERILKQEVVAKATGASKRSVVAKPSAPNYSYTWSNSTAPMDIKNNIVAASQRGEKTTFSKLYDGDWTPVTEAIASMAEKSFDEYLEMLSSDGPAGLLAGPFGAFGKTGKTLQLTSRARTVEKGLELASKFLKPGYTEIAPGVFRSSDQLRQFRMTTSDIMGIHGPGPHFNFEIFSPFNLNKAAKNYHVPLINP